LPGGPQEFSQVLLIVVLIYKDGKIAAIHQEKTPKKKKTESMAENQFTYVRKPGSIYKNLPVMNFTELFSFCNITFGLGMLLFSLKKQNIPSSTQDKKR
jgi:hypothetical protein